MPVDRGRETLTGNGLPGWSTDRLGTRQPREGTP